MSAAPGDTGPGLRCLWRLAGDILQVELGGGGGGNDVDGGAGGGGGLVIDGGGGGHVGGGAGGSGQDMSSENNLYNIISYIDFND